MVGRKDWVDAVSETQKLRDRLCDIAQCVDECLDMLAEVEDVMTDIKAGNGETDCLTLYSAISEPDEDGDRIERISLYPILDSEIPAEGYSFSHLVAWRWITHTGPKTPDTFHWRVSCRSREILDPSMRHKMGEPIGDGTDADAIAWLLEGEL